MAKKGLGKGLEALIPANPFGQKKTGDAVTLLSLDEIVPNAHQPRKSFNEDKLRELAQSIGEHGVVQPIVVRPTTENKFEVVAGERRWRAAHLAGLTEIPCIIKEFDGKLSTEVALIENIQREDLNAMEEAEAYRKLMEEFDYTQETLSGRLGKSRSYVANTLRLMNLPLPIQSFIREGILTAGHARAILSINSPESRMIFAEKIIKEKLSVRQAEEWAKQFNNQEKTKTPDPPKKNPLTPEIKDLETRLRGLLATKVKIKSGKNGGKIEIDYYGDDDLERIINTLLPESIL
ncbi:MAG: ParB/RepB/Spo0J family partition protein [Bacillota bacterium]|jgi:ParB family chromosome partitioning protein